ncbi:MAG: hypothetical protein SFU20_09315 [Chitinophagaceae bacterium]|nr:hypothetical protein [Chitinophagaceae bacterium]
MGFVYADIRLINHGDLILVNKSLKGEEEVRHINLRILVDTGAYQMCINESVREILDLPILEERWVELGDSRWVKLPIAGPVEVRFENRMAICNAIVLPGEAEPLLGAIPLEELDVIIDSKRQELLINPVHPDGAVLRV